MAAHEIMDGVATHDEPDPGRTRRRADGDHLPARRPSLRPADGRRRAPRGPALRRRRRGQDPAARRAARPRRRRGLAGRRRALPGLRRQRAALPAVLRGPRPAGRRPARRSSTRSRPPTPPWRGSSPAAGCSSAATQDDEPSRTRPRPTLFEAVHALLEAAARAGPAAAGGRGPALGRPVDPRPAQLPVHPAVRAGPVAHRRVVPLRRPAPPPPAPRARSPSGPGCAASTGCS